jgi:ParB-like chromosome segregation protein Spo0J
LENGLRGLRRRPIVVTAKGVVVNGHARVLAAQRLEVDELPVNVLSDSIPS